MEKKMETTIVYWGYMGIMEKKMETTIVYWGLYGDNGKENASIPDSASWGSTTAQSPEERDAFGD